MAELDNKLVTFASLKETVTRLKEYANQFEPRKEVVSKSKLTYSTNYIRAYCDYVATIPATVRITDDDGSVLLVTGSANGSWRAVRLIKGETDRFHKVYYNNGYVYIQVSNDSMYTVFGGSLLKVLGSATGTEITIENVADTHIHDNKEVLDLLSESAEGKLQYNGITIYDDTEVKSDIANLNEYKQNKTDNTLDTTDKTIVGAINEVKLSIPTRTSELENNSNFITNDDLPTVPTKVSDLENDSGFITSIPSEYITETELETKGYLTEHQDISNLALKSEIPDVSSFITSDDLPTVPTKVSELTNDKNYISSIPSEYITETELTAKKYLTSVPSTYALKTDIPTVPTKTSQLTNDSNFITSIPEEYITETELKAKGYLTSHQDISGLQTKTDKNLVTTSKEVVGAINEVKSLNDTKLNKTDANKLNCVIIDNGSLKEYILTNFTETGKTYYLIAKTTCTDLPKASNFYITVEMPGLYTYKVTAKELNDSNGIYVCTYRTISSSWTKWEKVCTTTVEDVPTVNVTSSVDTMVASINHISYTVKNGICYVWINEFRPLVTCNLTIILPNGTLPKASTRFYANINTWNEPNFSSILLQPNTNGSLSLWCDSNAINKPHYGSFSYPVAES